ncbi:MAG: protease modulator HflC [Alphaproteobacteria bacterium]|nr:MAG: protease modulator HflC [Alphaproteobacteria bacterium]
MKIHKAFYLVIAFALFVLTTNTFYIVPQTEQTVVMQFGALVRTEKDPGLHMKLPFVQDVMFFETRILDLDPPEAPVLLSDQLRINIDLYARYKIVDPFKFYVSARNEDGLNNRLGPTLNNKMRNEMAKITVADLLSDKRDDIMAAVKESMKADAKNFGIEVIDIRIGRSELPPEVSASTFARMKADREQRAKEARAQGAEKATQIRASADKERTVLLADANKESQILRGDGDASKTRILADAYSRDPKFFQLYRTLQAYRESMTNGDNTMVLSPESDFMKYLKNY